MQVQFFSTFILPMWIQVNLFLKPSFLHQLTHNMRRDGSLNSPKNTSAEHVLYKNCFWFFFVWHSNQYLFATCSELVFFQEFNEPSLVILWVNWFKNQSFWHRFTCIRFLAKKWYSFQIKASFPFNIRLFTTIWTMLQDNVVR